MKAEEERTVSSGQWNRRAFLSFGALGLFGAAVWGVRRWIVDAPRIDKASAPLRHVLDFNARVTDLYRSPGHLVKEYPKSAAVTAMRANGDDGLTSALDPATWALAVHAGSRNGGLLRTITMDQVRALPFTEIVYDFKCIEGWSVVSHWGGVRLSDFARAFKLGTRSGNTPDEAHPEDLFRYMGLSTPDNGYYVGIDMPSALHPQTLLAYEMNGEPLTEKHGAPLRLIIPTKYGVKNLKRIGVMYFSDERPPDYWHEQGYDYDCTL